MSEVINFIIYKVPFTKRIQNIQIASNVVLIVRNAILMVVLFVRKEVF